MYHYENSCVSPCAYLTIYHGRGCAGCNVMQCVYNWPVINKLNRLYVLRGLLGFVEGKWKLMSILRRKKKQKG